MAGVVITILAVASALLAILYQIYLGPYLKVLGIFHTVETFGLDNSTCKRISELQACEKIVLHQPSGLLYLACSNLEGRLQWMPSTQLFSVQGKSNDDYVATYDPVTSKITRLEFEKFEGNQMSVHGMDVVPSASDSNELYVYLVNHRAPPASQDPRVVGADSVIEVFKTTLKGKHLTHIKTIRDSVIVTPNDVVGQADGKGFFFTNDHASKLALGRAYRNAFFPTTSVGYCHLDHGCKIAASGLLSNNGIVKAPNDTIYVANTMGGKITVLERQADNSLLLTDVISIGQPLDNLSLDLDGRVWAAAFPKILDLFEQATKNVSHISPVAAFRVSANTGPNSFYGEKYKVEKVFEDDGTIVSGSTSVVHDSERGLLFMSGIAAPCLTVCHD